METFRCTNPRCKKPVLFEGAFTGIVRKKCPKCKETIEFREPNSNIFDKHCKI